MKLEAAAIPALGFVEVPEGGDVFVGRAEVEGADGCCGPVTDPFEQNERLTIRLCTRGLSALALDLAELVNRCRERSDPVAFAVIEGARIARERRRGLRAAPASCRRSASPNALSKP